MNFVKKALCTGATVVTATVVSVAPAQAAPDKAPAGGVGIAHYACGTTISDKDSSSWVKSAYGANERSGSSTTCAKNGVADAGERLDYHCYTTGNDGITWTYLRNDTDGTAGWVRDDLLSDLGSNVACG